MLIAKHSVQNINNKNKVKEIKICTEIHGYQKYLMIS